MKKIAVALCLVVSAALVVSCAKGPTVPVAGTAKAEDMLTLLPKDIAGLVVVDLHAALTTDLASKAIKESKEYAKYEAFIRDTGIDPQKDVFFLAIAGITGAGADKRTGVGVVNLRYDKDKLLAKIKAESEGQEVREETYEGVPLFVGVKDDKPMAGAFLDGSNIALGPEPQVKAVIDVLKKKTDSAAKNADLRALLKTANKTAMVWSGFLFKPEDLKTMVESSPFLKNLEALRSLTFFFDYKAGGLEAEINLKTTDPAKTKELADALTGLKAFGAMAGAEKPEIAEVVQKIEITSGPDNIKIYTKLPEELLQKLGKQAEAMAREKLGAAKPAEEGAEAKVEKKEEKPPVKK